MTRCRNIIGPLTEKQQKKADLNRRYYLAHKTEMDARSKDYAHKNGIYKSAKHKWRMAKNRATKKQREFTITVEDTEKIVSEQCFYCGETEEARGLDRWQNDLGYTINNCVPACWPCNNGKSDYTAEEYIEHCRKVVKFWDNKEM